MPVAVAAFYLTSNSIFKAMLTAQTLKALSRLGMRRGKILNGEHEDV